VAAMRIAFICQAVDHADPVMASTISWIRALADRPQVERLSVLALRVGKHNLPRRLDIRRIQESNRIASLVRFYREVFRALHLGTDCFFIYQGGPYPALLLPFRSILGKRVFQWKAHPRVPRSMAFYARWCEDLVFTSTRSAFPLDLQNVRIVGQGVDTKAFRPTVGPLLGDLVAVGRIAPSKQIDQMIHALAAANRVYGAEYGLDIYGPVLPGEGAYLSRLRALVEDLGMQRFVRWKGTIDHEQLPQVLSGYRACLNFSRTAIDRSAVEAMACGIPVISTNECLEEILPSHLLPTLMVDDTSTSSQARTIHRLLSAPDDERRELGKSLRSMVVRDHNVDGLFDRMLKEMQGVLDEKPRNP
jgi:glycosyltransferase involved in cell wall biosynthesis